MQVISDKTTPGRDLVPVSFIIPHKGRTEMLVRTLESIGSLALDTKHIRFAPEILVITQNDDLTTLSLSSMVRLPAGIRLHVIVEDGTRTISALRNIGLHKAKGEYVAFLDADVALSPNWLTVMYETLHEVPGRRLVSAVQTTGPNPPPLERIRTALSNAVTDASVRFLPGRNLFMARDTAISVGGFPEHLETCEDYYFTSEVAEQGELFYTSRAHYVHLGEDKRLDDMFHKEIWRGKSNLLSVRGRNIPLEEWPSFLVPLWILFFTLTGLVSLLLGNGSGFLISLTLTMLPVLLYSLRLYWLAKPMVTFWQVLQFYLVYFPARILGTLKGLKGAVCAGKARKKPAPEKLNVLQFICPTGFYGAERWILALAKHMPEDHAQSFLAVTLEPNTHDLELVRYFRQLGKTAFEVPMNGRFDIRVIGRLVKLIREQDIHVIHTHGYKSDIIGVLAAKWAGIPCVVTPHGFENAEDIKLRAFIWLGCQAMKFADRVAPLSPALMEDVRRIGVKPEKVRYIQNGVDLSEVEAVREKRTSLKAENDRRLIGFIGQLISRKNIPAMLRVFDRVADRIPDVELVLIGDGEDRPELERLAGTLKHGQAVRFLGFRPDRLEWLARFDLFVMTSTLEGIPRCLMETAAMGVPMAAFDIPGVDQIIHHEETGLLAPPGDESALAAHWVRLLEDASLAETLAKNAQDYVYIHYSAQRMADEYMELFRQLVGSTLPIPSTATQDAQ